MIIKWRLDIFAPTIYFELMLVQKGGEEGDEEKEEEEEEEEEEEQEQEQEQEE